MHDAELITVEPDTTDAGLIPLPEEDDMPDPAALPDEPLTVLHEIAAERDRQRAKGYDAAHDDEHWNHEIITAAWGARERLRPFRYSEGDRRKAYIEAAALIVAEIERMDRAYDRLSAAEG